MTGSGMAVSQIALRRVMPSSLPRKSGDGSWFRIQRTALVR
jgi:hypothetical protein